MNRLRKIRIAIASLLLVAITLLFLDFTGTIHGLFGWMAKIQFIPALLALNVGVIIALVALTFLFGRIYCSVICPLGVFQDVISRVASQRKKHRFNYSPAIKWLRYGALGIFAIAFVAGLSSLVALLEPYSAYGRIVSNLLSPIYAWVNNLLAYIAERADSYAFYNTEVWVKSIGTLVVSITSLVVIVVLAWRGGRTYCNTVCPVGTILGLLSKYSLYKHRIDEQKCNACGLCARNCKSSCIDSKTHTIDYSRCVSCFNCIDKCNKDAITYSRCGNQKEELSKESKPKKQNKEASDRRTMLTVSATLLGASALKAQENKVDGGLAFIEDKKIPKRQTAIVPPGAQSIRNFTKRCTGCQLCVSLCPNQVLRPSTNLTTFMQPEMSYERGYCRPECTKCADACPAGAIHSITTADKSAIQIGHAVWIEKNCVVLTDGVNCGNCARHCPVGAITMVESSSDGLEPKKIPAINTERCIGCGACENLCPARPFSAIYIEGHISHRII